MKPIKPLGDAKLGQPLHLPLAQLRSVTDAWPTKFGAYAGYVFKGYRIGPDGVPTFRYEVNGLQVEDTVRPAADGASLCRTVKVRSESGDATGWYFRGVTNDPAPQPLEWRNGSATFEEVIRF